MTTVNFYHYLAVLKNEENEVLLRVSAVACCVYTSHEGKYPGGGTRYILGWGGAARPLIP